jgi:NADH:ubiquinone reductase (H+-translocating)
MSNINKPQTRIPDIGKPRIVIIGGGFGGLELVKALRHLDVQVVLLDKHNHHTFQPLLYQVATSGLETNSIVYPFRKRFGKQHDFYFRLGEVTHISPEENLIETSIGSLSYDYLVIATGTVTNYYGNQEIEEKAFSLKNIQDAISLRNRIIKNFEEALLTDNDEVRNSLMDFVIVGGGPTGVEIAGALAELRNHIFPRDYKELNFREMDIYIIEGGERLLGSMSEIAGKKAQEFLENMGVRIRLNTRVKSYNGYRVEFADGNHLISKTLIWAAGVTCKPIPGIRKESIVRGNRLLTDEFNLVSGYENIYAIGDVAAMITEANPNGYPQLAQPAMQQASQLAKNFKNKFKNKPLKPFKYFDKGSMATIGRNKAVVDMGKFQMQGFLAWFIWMFIHLLYLVGFRNRFMVLISWAWSYFTYDRSNRLIIGRLGNEDKNPIKAQDVSPDAPKV